MEKTMKKLNSAGARTGENIFSKNISQCPKASFVSKTTPLVT